MNYISFQKKILSMVNSPKKLKNFDWAYEDGYVYITITRCEIFRIPLCYMYLNLGSIKTADQELVTMFNDCCKWASECLFIAKNPISDYSGKYPMIKLFENSEIWLDINRLNEFGSFNELSECVHFTGYNRGVILWNESDEPIGLLLGIRRKQDENNS